MDCGAVSLAGACWVFTSVSTTAEGTCLIPSSARAWFETDSNARGGEDPVRTLAVVGNSCASKGRLRDG
jgi:hypothetical protein